MHRRPAAAAATLTGRRLGGQVLRSIALPPSRGWRELVPRLVLNLKQPRLPSSLPELFRLSSWQEMQLQMALPRTDILERYRTCAVVGNAGAVTGMQLRMRVVSADAR